MSDGKPLFASNHKNLLTGATSALSADSLKKAIQIFLNQTDADGQPETGVYTLVLATRNGESADAYAVAHATRRV